MFKLQKQILDLHYHDEEKARDFQDRARQVYYSRILGEMETILKRYDEDESLFRINDMELDLGEIYEDEFDGEWVKRFREAFEAELKKRIRLIQTEKGPTKDTQIPIRKRHAEIFEYYLLHGTLPWNADDEKLTPTSMAEELLGRYPMDLILILKKHGNNEKLIQRLVFQLTEKQIIRIIEIVQPTEAKFIVDTIEKIDITRRKESFVKADSIYFRSKLWEFVLRYILVDRGSYFNTKEFVKATLFGIADHFNMERVQLIIQFYQAIRHLQKEILLSMNLQRIIGEIYEEVMEGRTDTDAPRSLEEEIFGYETVGDIPPPGHFTPKNPTTGESIQHILDQLIFNPIYSELIKNWLLEKGTDAAFRKKVSDSIRSFKQFEKLVKLLDSPNAEYILDFSKRLQKNQEEQHIFPTTASRFQKDKYYFILTVLLSNRGSYFNKKSFVKQVLQQLAKHYGIEFHALLLTLIRAVPLKMRGLSQLPEILQLLSDLEKEENRNAANTESARPKKLTAKLLTEIIEHWVRSGSTPAGIPEYAAAKQMSFEQVWAHFLSIKKVEESWVQSFFADMAHIRFLVDTLSEPLFEATMERFIPADMLEYVFVLHKIGQRMFAEAKRVSIDIREFREQQMEFVLQHFNTLRKHEIAPETFVEKLMFFYARVLKMEVADLLEKTEAAALTYTPPPKQVQATVQKLRTRYETKREKQLREKPGAPEMAVRKFIMEWGNLPRSSEVFQRELLAVVKHLASIDEKHVLVFLNEIFSAPTFSEFVRKHAGKEFVTFMRRYPVDENGYFLVYLIKDIERILAKGTYSIPNFNTVVDQALVYTWFLGDQKEKEYARQLLYFLAEAKKTERKTFFTTLRDVALTVKTELESKIILYLTPESAPPKPDAAQTGRSAAQDKNAQSPHEAARNKKNIPGDKDNNKQKPEIPFEPTGENEDPKVEQTDAIAVNNSGMVILGAFILPYFTHLKMLEGNDFVSDEARQRAVHLLQYMASGHPNLPEHELALPKILCGMHPSDPIIAGIEVTEAEKALTESLLRRIVELWTALGTTSIDGLRGSFLIRKGMLFKREENWELQAESKGFDILIDKLGWSITLTKLPWMKIPLYCKWR